MNEKLEKRLKEAALKYEKQNRVAKRVSTQFIAGAKWLWDDLMKTHDAAYYQEQLTKDVEDREGEVAQWKESLIAETASMMARRERIERSIEKDGDLLEKWDKNGMPYKESNPLHVHLKELDRSIGMQREHLGLSNKVNPTRMTTSSRKASKEDDPLQAMYGGVVKALEDD